MKEKNAPEWKAVKDASVRHVWSDPDGGHTVTVDPSFYADAGTPVCSEGPHEGEDMHYVRTEILQ